ncbi:nutritionally-regulated adipose and cardiac enriched protein homolog [Chiloscyllium punctatum]|uniref:nutritionally-regulated adipose and cardiac enriched protein homolog n=1 Tax=Chiloscyllium punctatum TaxID=137246 RepID=UPI003B63A68B
MVDKTDSKQTDNSAVSQDSTADRLLDLSNKVLPQRFENSPDIRRLKTNTLSSQMCHAQEVIALKCPASILRRKSKMTQNADGYVSHRARTERRVRFQELDEIIFDTNSCNSHLPALLRKLLIVILLSLMMVMLLYCSETTTVIYEQLQSKLNSVFLEMKNLTFSWLTWSRKN